MALVEHAERRQCALHAAVLLAAVMLSYKLGQHTPKARASTPRKVTAAATTASRATIVLESMWCTPIARTHLRTHPAIGNLTRFNEQLSEQIESDHAAFLLEHAAQSADLTSSNDLFFEYQSGTGSHFNRSHAAVQARLHALSFRRSAAFKTLASAAATLASSMLSFWPHAARHSARSRRLQAWATVHTGNSRHQLHVHAGATLSIVYYVKTGLKSGALRLLDARGPRPPFEGDVQVVAEEGQMVAFPGWLAHEVETGGGGGGGDDVRISVVFNVRGGWEGTDEGGADVAPIGDWSRSACGWQLDWLGAVAC